MSTGTKARRGLAVLGAAAIAAVGCGRDSVTPVSVAVIEISPVERTLYLGSTVGLTAVPRDESGNSLDDRPIEWSSDDPDVASVDESGSVEAQGPGEATIKATAENVTGQATITVESPSLILSDTAVALEAGAGESGGAEHTVDVTTNDDASLADVAAAVSYAEDEPTGWLEATLEGTTAPTTVLLAASAADLSTGVFHASVEVTAPLAENSPQTIEVTFDVEGGPLRIDPKAVGFATAEGQPDPSPQTLEIRSVGGRELTGLSMEISYGEDQPDGWLSAELDGDATPATLTLDIEADDLDSGVFDAFVNVSSPDASNSPRARVRLTVGEPPPEIELDPSEIEIEKPEQEESPSERTVSVENRGTGDLGGLESSIDYDPADSDDWLETSFDDDAAPTDLKLSARDPELSPGTYQATVSVRSADAINSPQPVSVTLTVVPRASPTRSRIEADPESITADGSTTSLITVQLRDPRGDPMPKGGDEVTLATSAGDLADVDGHGEGRYTATLTAGTEPGTATITGTVNGETIQDQATVTFVPGEASTETSTITAEPESLPADGSSTADVTVRLRDAQGNDLGSGGDDVELETSAGEISDVEDQGDGTYTATFTAGTEPGAATITGTVNGDDIDDNAVVELVAADPSAENSTITAQPSSIPADGESTSSITVQLRDAQDNAITSGGDDVELDASAGELSDVEDQGDGTYTAALTGDQPSTATITGTVNGENIQDQATVVFLPSSVSGETSTITAQPALTTLLNGSSTITVVLRDADGNELTSGGDNVQLATDAGELSDVQDQGDGTYTATLTGDQAGTATITGTVNGENIGDDATVEFVPGDPSGETSTITAQPSSIPADGESTSTITVQLRDAQDNDITSGGDNVTIGSSAGALSAVADQGGGTYTATLTAATQAGTATITGTVNGENIGDDATVQFVVGDPSGANSSITAQPNSVPADGSSTSTITVQLRDAQDSDITSGGDNVQLATDAGDLSGVQDQGDGTYTATLTGDQAGTATISGTVNGETIQDEAVVVFLPSSVSGETSTITAQPALITLLNSSSTITVVLRDGNGNELTSGGDVVELTTTNGELSGVTDNGDGTYMAVLSPPGALIGSATITGTVNGEAIQDNAVVEFLLAEEPTS